MCNDTNFVTYNEVYSHIFRKKILPDLLIFYYLLIVWFKLKREKSMLKNYFTSNFNCSFSEKKKKKFFYFFFLPNNVCCTMLYYQGNHPNWSEGWILKRWNYYETYQVSEIGIYLNVLISFVWTNNYNFIKNALNIAVFKIKLCNF